MSYSLIKADINLNKNEIFRIWDRNYPGALEKKFKWIYKNNPAGKAHVWLLKHEVSGEFIGITALFPKKFAANGTTLLAGITGDLVVDKEHRSLGPAMMLQKAVISAVQDGTFDFIYGFPNKASEPVFKRAGYQILGERIRLVKILKTAPKLMRLPFGKYWGLLLSPILDAVLRLSSAETWFFLSKKFQCEDIKNIDERFDHLWEKQDFRYNILGERAKSHLKWKFFTKPDNNRIFIIYDSDKKHIKGYIIYRQLEKTIEIRDFLFTSDKEASSALIAGFLRHARSLKADSVVIAMLRNNKFIQFMKQFGFIERKDEQKIFVLFSDKALTLHPSLKNNADWLLLQSDDDM